MRSKSLAQRLGYLIEYTLHVDAPTTLKALRKIRGDAFVALGSPARYGRNARYTSDWRIIVNVPDSELLGEVSIR